MLLLLLLALGTPGTGAFVVQVASECPVVATNGSFDLAVLFNKAPLVCVDSQGPPKFVPCAGGPLGPIGLQLAQTLNKDPQWGPRLRSRGRVCTQVPPKVWGETVLRKVPPQIRIVASTSGLSPSRLVLTCHAWGFYPAELSLVWLRNGGVVGPQDPPGDPPALPTGGGTFRSQRSIEVTAGTGDTFTCSVRHPSLERPLLLDWEPTLPPGLALLVAAATLALILGLLLLLFGLWRYQRQPRPVPGYTPIPGDT